MIDRLPRRQFTRQHAPRAAALQEIENAIQDHAPAMFSWATCHVFGWQVWPNLRPLGIIQVGWVNLLRFGHPTSLPNLPIFSSFQTLTKTLHPKKRANTACSGPGYRPLQAAMLRQISCREIKRSRQVARALTQIVGRM